MSHPPKYDPTPAEIAAECEAIRAEWDEKEEQRRRCGWRTNDYTVPVVRVNLQSDPSN